MLSMPPLPSLKAVLKDLSVPSFPSLNSMQKEKTETKEQNGKRLLEKIQELHC